MLLWALQVSNCEDVMQEILGSVFLFTGILLVLTLTILWVQARLAPKCTILGSGNEER